MLTLYNENSLAVRLNVNMSCMRTYLCLFPVRQSLLNIKIMKIIITDADYVLNLVYNQSYN